MIYPPKTKQSKNDVIILLQSPSAHEAQDLIDLKLSYLKDSETIPLYVDEYNSEIGAEEALIQQYETSLNSLLLVAYSDGVMIGNIDITANSRKRLSHSAMLGMGIANQWQNKGIGRLLMQEALDWCRQYSSLEIIWLDVYASNDAGMALYKKMNFQISGRIPRFFKHQEAYFDKIQMYLEL